MAKIWEQKSITADTAERLKGIHKLALDHFGDENKASTFTLWVFNAAKMVQPGFAHPSPEAYREAQDKFIARSLETVRPATLSKYAHIAPNYNRLLSGKIQAAHKQPTYKHNITRGEVIYWGEHAKDQGKIDAAFAEAKANGWEAKLEYETREGYEAWIVTYEKPLSNEALFSKIEHNTGSPASHRLAVRTSTSRRKHPRTGRPTTTITRR